MDGAIASTATIPIGTEEPVTITVLKGKYMQLLLSMG